METYGLDVEEVACNEEVVGCEAEVDDPPVVVVPLDFGRGGRGVVEMTAMEIG